MFNKTLTLSIVIPVYNEEDYLSACLDSIVAQAVMPDEVIVVDNNSTDQTVNIAKRYPFVKLINESKQGVAFARNKGFKIAKGAIIGRIDGDSILPSDWTVQVKKTFVDNDVAAANGPVTYYDMPFPRTNYWVNHIMCLYTKWTAPNSPFLFGTNMAIRRSVWQKVAQQVCRADNIHEDIDLAIHLAENRLFINYSRLMLAAASGRRYNARPADFFGYVAMFSRVYRQHQLFNVSMYFSMSLWCLGYVVYNPVRWLWQAGYSLSGANYPLSTKSRKNPMSSYIKP